MRALCSPAMVEHSLRTYWFSAIVAAQHGAKVDREELFVAAAMHDVGLFIAERPGDERCFTVTEVAHWRRRGGLVEVLAQGWRLHDDNLAEILVRHPREGFADDSLVHVRRELVRNPGCRFACLDPLFPWLVWRARFSR